MMRIAAKILGGVWIFIGLIGIISAARYSTLGETTITIAAWGTTGAMIGTGWFLLASAKRL